MLIYHITFGGMTNKSNNINNGENNSDDVVRHNVCFVLIVVVEFDAKRWIEILYPKRIVYV